MTVSSKTRFEVFKRDRFTCAYCGRHAPDVLLEVDHIHPKAAGGTDDFTNLVTACEDCNRGKSDRLLDEAGQPVVGRRTVVALEERLAQAKAYVELLGELSSVTDALLNRVIQEWAKAFGAQSVERDGGHYWDLGHAPWPNDATIRIFLRELQIDQILTAVDMAASKVGPTSGADRYFYAICWRMIREKQAQTVPLDDVVALQVENSRLLDRLGEAEERIHDLNVTIRRFREETGRE